MSRLCLIVINFSMRTGQGLPWTVPTVEGIGIPHSFVTLPYPGHVWYMHKSTQKDIWRMVSRSLQVQPPQVNHKKIQRFTWCLPSRRDTVVFSNCKVSCLNASFPTLYSLLHAKQYQCIIMYLPTTYFPTNLCLYHQAISIHTAVGLASNSQNEQFCCAALTRSVWIHLTENSGWLCGKYDHTIGGMANSGRRTSGWGRPGDRLSRYLRRANHKQPTNMSSLDCGKANGNVCLEASAHNSSWSIAKDYC